MNSVLNWEKENTRGKQRWRRQLIEDLSLWSYAMCECYDYVWHYIYSGTLPVLMFAYPAPTGGAENRGGSDPAHHLQWVPAAAAGQGGDGPLWPPLIRRECIFHMNTNTPILPEHYRGTHHVCINLLASAKPCYCTTSSGAAQKTRSQSCVNADLEHTRHFPMFMSCAC